MMGKAGFRWVRTAALLASAAALPGLGACQPDRPELIAFVEPLPVYCYQTLAKPDCYAQPVPGDFNRMIGFYGPPPVETPSPQIPDVTITRTGRGI
jgi:hypothetical protein